MLLGAGLETHDSRFQQTHLAYGTVKGAHLRSSVVSQSSCMCKVWRLPLCLGGLAAGDNAAEQAGNPWSVWLSCKAVVELCSKAMLEQLQVR